MKKILTFLERLWTASIRRQLMLGIILVHAVLMSIFVYDLVERQRNFLHTQIVKQAGSLAATLAANSTSWVLANDVIGLEEIVRGQINYPALRYAMVLSPEGRVLGHTQIDKVGLYINDAISGKLLTTEKEQIILVDNNLSIDIAAPISSNGVFIGWARISLSQKENVNNLQIITRNGLFYTLLAIIIGALFAFFMARGITRGLQQIVDVAEGIKIGKQSLRANISRHDEIGTLGENFNIMLDTIAKSKRDLQATMDNSPTVIYVKDIHGRFTFINQRFEKLFHINREDVIGKTLHDIFEKDIADEMYKNDKDVIETGRAQESEEHAPQDDGMHLYSSIKFPLCDDNENIYAVCGISTDMTDRIRIEKEKSTLENQLFHAQKIQAIGQLTGGVAHDFNNLLAVILGYAELGIDQYGSENESLNSYFKEIETAGIRGRELVKQMMLYSRKDSTQNDFVSVEVEEIIEETASMLTATFPAGISIETSIEKNLPHVMASPNLLSQVLMNLCINAKDGMGKEGKLLITLKTETLIDRVCHSCVELYSGDYVSIIITDNGTGIDDDKLNRIFEPFFTTKEIGEGTGMGLSVVHGAAHKLGGHIHVESVVGEGTSFKILLPVSKQEVKFPDTKIPENMKYDFSGLNIIIVDDEPAVTALLEKSLDACKANVSCFNDSELALAYFEKNPNKVDLVITDQTMPNLTGITLSGKLLALRPDIKIILCTGHSADVTEESALKCGVKKFIYKPVKTTDLYKIINELR